MKLTLVSTAAIALFTAAQAFANPLCEPPGHHVTDGDGTYYNHGCHAFAMHDLSENQARQLWNAGHCSMWNPLGGGVEEIEIVDVDYGVADGSTHDRDNLTSMGAAASSGEQVLRVRSASNGNTVTIRRAGHPGVVFNGTVDAGDTFVQVGPPGNYIAATGSRTITKATGPQTFDDLTTVEVTVDDPTGGQYQAGIPLCDEPQITRQ